jgi:hypothetical protein
MTGGRSLEQIGVDPGIMILPLAGFQVSQEEAGSFFVDEQDKK